MVSVDEYIDITTNRINRDEEVVMWMITKLKEQQPYQTTCTIYI